LSVLNFEKGKIELKNSGERAKLTIYGEIVSTEWDKWDNEDIAPQDIQDLLYQIGDMDLDIYINSVGGSVFAGMAIYNMLKRHSGHKTVYVDGIAASISSVIAMAGDRIIIPSNSYFMMHKAWGRFLGNADELRDQAEALDVLDEGILFAYKDKLNTDIDIELIKHMIAKETWLTGVEAQKYFNVELSDAVEIAASFDREYCNKHKVPDNLKALLDTVNKTDFEARADEEKVKLELEKEKLLLII
jgi:ATP-dependent protease ClpP protease subunit